MKRISFVCLFLTLTLARLSAQSPLPLDPDTKKITFSAVVNVGSTQKSELAKRAQDWGAKTKYLVPKAQAPGQYKCKGTLMVQYPSIAPGKTDKGTVTFFTTLYLKDGKYKYVMTDFVHQDLLGRGDGGKLENETPECGKFIMSTTSWNKIKDQTQSEMEKVIAGLKADMEKKPAPVKKKPNDF
jgi:hypothetical protein